MIWAGIVFLQKVTNKSEEEIRRLPYPEFKAMIEYHSDPEAFLKAGVTEKDHQDMLAAAQQQNMAMQRKAKEAKDKMKKEKE